MFQPFLTDCLFGFQNIMDALDGLEYFLFLKNQLNAYYEKDCFSAAVAADVKNATDCFLDWLHGDHIGNEKDTMAWYQFG